MTSEIVRETNRKHIIEVSTELFITQGIPVTSIRQIAKKAGVVERTVLNIFGTKQNLVLECMVHMSEQILTELGELTASPEYKSLCGLEQAMYLLKMRGEILMHRPDILLLVSEAKVWVARGIYDKRAVGKYMENVEFLSSITEKALNKGIADGSIDSAINIQYALSILVHSFRAVIQQLAQVILNPEFSKAVDVEKQLQIQYEIMRDGLKNHDALPTTDRKQGDR